jgi:hypothetical protein
MTFMTLVGLWRNGSCWAVKVGKMENGKSEKGERGEKGKSANAGLELVAKSGRREERIWESEREGSGSGSGK